VAVWTRSNLLRLTAALLLVAATAAVYFSPLAEWLTVENIRQAARAIGDIWYAPLLFVVAYAVGCVVWLPASIFVLAAGVIWGWQLGGIYSIIGANIGATASFLVARYIGGGSVLAHLGDRGRAVAKQLEHAGFGSFLLLRVLPIFPFAVLNYGAGFAGLRLRHFFLATLIGTSPVTFVVTYSADALLAGTLSQEDAVKRILIAGALLAVVVGLPLLLRRRAARALHVDPEAPETR
jgi:uncharacterized membrane protein YdjX (TVP38/TMEM64 family)